MKKRLFSLCIMLTAMTVSMRAGVKIDATSFPDENFRKCVSDKRIDQNQDGYLNDEELDAVKELNLNNMIYCCWPLLLQYFLASSHIQLLLQ